MAIALDLSASTTGDSSLTVGRCRLAAGLLIVGTLAWRLVYLAFFCPLDLAPDEAHYWDWSRHLDWSYYSKGPLVALLIRGSCALFGDTMLAVRLPAVLCGALLLGGLYVLTTVVHRSERLALIVVGLVLTLPIIHVGGLLMTIDAPFTCCWCWALVFAHRAAVGERAWAWPVTGALVGLGILAKYTMILFVPMLALFVVQQSGWRNLLRNRSFWIMTMVAAAATAPILVWNAHHGWVTFLHAQGHAGLRPHVALVQWLGPLKYLGTQIGLLLGFWFVVWVASSWTHRPWRESNPSRQYLWWLSVPVFLFFGVFSGKNGGGEANWPVAAYLAGLVLAAGWLADAWRRSSPVQRGILGGLVGMFAGLGLMATFLMCDSRWAMPLLARLAGPEASHRPLPLRRWDPTCRLKGWRALAAEIDGLRRQLRHNGLEPVLAAAAWNIPGELGFYCEGQPNVYCLAPLLGERHNQYDLWRPNPVADPELFRGHIFLLVGVSAEKAKALFERVQDSFVFTYREHGHAVAAWQITVAIGYRGLSQSISAESEY